MNCFAGDNSLTNALIAPKVFLGRLDPADDRVIDEHASVRRLPPVRHDGLRDGLQAPRQQPAHPLPAVLTCLEVVKPDNTDPRAAGADADRCGTLQRLRDQRRELCVSCARCRSRTTRRIASPESSERTRLDSRRPRATCAGGRNTPASIRRISSAALAISTRPSIRSSRP